MIFCSTFFFSLSRRSGSFLLLGSGRLWRGLCVVPRCGWGGREVYDFFDAGRGEIGQQVVVFVEMGGAEIDRPALYDAVEEDPLEVSAGPLIQTKYGGQRDVHFSGAFLELLVKMPEHGEETVSEVPVVGGGGRELGGFGSGRAGSPEVGKTDFHSVGFFLAVEGGDEASAESVVEVSFDAVGEEKGVGQEHGLFVFGVDFDRLLLEAPGIFLPAAYDESVLDCLVVSFHGNHSEGEGVFEVLGLAAGYCFRGYRSLSCFVDPFLHRFFFFLC